MAKAKFYVVWKGVNPGIYTSWNECLLQTKGYTGAVYKSFATLQEAEEAYSCSPYRYMKKKSANVPPSTALPSEIIDNSIAVDAACSGNPGAMEYRGVYIAAGQELFHFGPVYGTNNIGEFLAIVHALAVIKQMNYNVPVVYSDSANALSWVRQKKCKTKLPLNDRTKDLFDLITRAEYWLSTNTYTTKLIKWETKKWGEIPADFGRK